MNSQKCQWHSKHRIPWATHSSKPLPSSRHFVGGYFWYSIRSNVALGTRLFPDWITTQFEILKISPWQWNIGHPRSVVFWSSVTERHSWYVRLLTLGNYELGRFEVPGIGLRLAYDPGTIVAVAGKTIAHGVSPCEGDRVCITYFMRDGVHEQLGIRAGGWMNINYYK